MICTDYDQQELRMLAHYDAGLTRIYLENPSVDIHELVRQMIYKDIGVLYPRKSVKTTVFGIVYGMGAEKLSHQLDISKSSAYSLKDGVMKAIPGIERQMRELKRLVNHNKPMRTWGGREYFCEEPRFVKKRGRIMEFGYKLLNYRVQGGSADYTKEGMIQVNQQVPQVRIAIQVHDEVVAMAPHHKYGPRIVRAMCQAKLNVPMTATAKYSTRSWARAKEAA